MPYYRTRYECYEEVEDLVNVVPAKVTGEHTHVVQKYCATSLTNRKKGWSKNGWNVPMRNLLLS